MASESTEVPDEGAPAIADALVEAAQEGIVSNEVVTQADKNEENLQPEDLGYVFEESVVESKSN